MTSIPDPKEQAPYRRPEAKVDQSENRFALRPIGKRTLTPRKWVVEGLIAEETLVAIYGKPGAGKSFLALDLACAVATGTSWMGCQATAGLAIYVAGEGREDLAYRLASWKQFHGTGKMQGVGDLNVLEPGAGDFSFFRPFDTDHLIKAISGASEQRGVPAKVIVIDTLSSAMPGEDENSQAAMSKVVEACNRIMSETGAAVVLIHHPNKANAHEMRGNSVLLGRVDTSLLAEKSGRGGTMTVKKQRFRDDGASYHFRLKPVCLSLDNNTETSCAVEFVSKSTPDKQTGRNTAPAAKKPSGNDLLALLHGLMPPGTMSLMRSQEMTHFRVPYNGARQKALSDLYSAAATYDAKRKRFERDLRHLEQLNDARRDGTDILIPIQDEDEIGGSSGKAA